MTYPSISYDEYVKTGQAKGLEMVGPAPDSVREMAHWRCMNCKAESHKTLRAVRNAQKGCSCQGETVLTSEDYVALAEELDIEWIGQYPPKNTKAVTLWRNPRNKQVVETSYYHLGYHHIRRDLRRMLGIIVWADLYPFDRECITQLIDSAEEQTKVVDASKLPPEKRVDYLEDRIIIKSGEHYIQGPVLRRLKRERDDAQRKRAEEFALDGRDSEIPTPA